MKKYILIIILVFVLFIGRANAASPITTTCDVGTTNGALYATKWGFKITKMCPPTDINCIEKDKRFSYEFYYSSPKWCQTASGCSGDSWSTTRKSQITDYNAINSLFKDSAFENIFATEAKGVAGVYTNSGLKSLLSKSGCPNYIYVASSAKKQKIGFIFSSQKVSNAKELLESAGYTVEFTQDGGEDLTNVSKTNYENQVKKMKDNIKEFKDKDWGNTYNESCTSYSKFGGMIWGDNLVIEYYDKYKEALFKAIPSYDFSAGEKVLEEYKTMDCAPKPVETGDIENIKLSKMTCETLFKNGDEYNNTWKLLNTTLKFMQYLGVTLALVLSIIDFIKVVPTQEKDAIKKASTKAVTRLVIAIVIFFVPIIIDFILGLVGFNNPTCGLL